MNLLTYHLEQNDFRHLMIELSDSEPNTIKYSASLPGGNYSRSFIEKKTFHFEFFFVFPANDLEVKVVLCE